MKLPFLVAVVCFVYVVINLVDTVSRLERELELVKNPPVCIDDDGKSRTCRWPEVRR